MVKATIPSNIGSLVSDMFKAMCNPIIESSSIELVYSKQIARKGTLSTDMGKYYTGKAKCQPVDEFDETIGKRIAASKAYSKYVKDKMDKLELITKIYDRQHALMMSRAEELRKTYQKILDNENAKLTKAIADGEELQIQLTKDTEKAQNETKETLDTLDDSKHHTEMSK